MYYLGIDWATEKHDLCLLDEDGTIVQQLEIKQSNDGFQRFESLVNRYGAANILLNIERSDGLLFDWILVQGWAVHVTPSMVVAHRRPRCSKSDPSDAYLLARALDKTIVDQRRQIADAPPFQGQSGWKGVRKEQ